MLFPLSFVGDWMFIIQIFLLLTIMSFVLNHLGKGPLSVITIGVTAFFVFFIIPALSYAVFIIYILLFAGVSSVLIDFFFITAGQQPQKGQGGFEEPDVDGMDIKERREAMEKARHGAHAAQRSAGMVRNMMMRR
ncbi:MAG: hypothetical protein V1847_02540 [Candidatus Diapherotrites archaeon]